MAATYKVRDRQTGQIINVPQEQLGTYGLSSPAPTTTQPATQQPSPSSATSPKYITGRTLDEHIGALQRAKTAGDTAAVKLITDDYNREFEYQKNIGTFDKPANSASQKKRETILNQAAPVLGRIIESAMKAPTGFKGAWQATIGQVPGVEGGEAEYLARDTEGFARLIASAFASEVGVATDRDVARWKKIMPQPGDTMNERIRQSNKLIEQIKNESSSLNMAVPPTVLEAAKLLGGNVPSTKPVDTQVNYPQTTQEMRQALPITKDQSYAEQSRLLAKRALQEKDPTKKTELLAQSRALSDVAINQGELQDKTSLPVKIAGKAQQFLSESEALPIGYSIIGRILGGGSSLGTGAGAATGEYLKTVLKRGQDRSPMTLKEAGGIALKGAEYAAIDKILSTGGKTVSDAWRAKTINPTKIAGFMREKAAEATPTINTAKILEAGERWSKLDPGSKEVWKTLKPAISKNMDTKDLLDVLTSWGKRTWTLSGAQKDKAGAELMKHIYNAGRESILSQAPEVAKYTANLRAIKEIPETIKGAQKISWLVLKLLGIGKLL